MRVLQVINSLLVGGAERNLVNTSLALQEAGCNLEVCTVYHDGPLATELRDSGITVYDLGIDPGIARYDLRRKYDPRAAFRLRGVIRKGKYDLVHTHLFPASYFAAAASLTARASRYVFSEHNVHNRRRGKRWLRPLERAVYSRFERVVAVSPEVATTLGEWMPRARERVRVVSNGVETPVAATRASIEETRTELGINEGGRVIVFAGRFERAKGPDILARALIPLLDNDPTISAIFAGDGPLRHECEQLIEGTAAASSTHFVGRRSDVTALMQLADLVVLPSRWEGLPMTLLEALATATPVVATRVGGMPGIVQESRGGWLAPAEDPSQLAATIAEALGSSDERAKRGKSGARFVAEHYSARASADKLLQLYAEVVSV